MGLRPGPVRAIRGVGDPRQLPACSSLFGRQHPRFGAVRMPTPTEPIGSIPRPLPLIEAVAKRRDGTDPALHEDMGVSVLIDGEQRTYRDFWAYSMQGVIRARVRGTAMAFRI